MKKTGKILQIMIFLILCLGSSFLLPCMGGNEKAIEKKQYISIPQLWKKEALSSENTSAEALPAILYGNDLKKHIRLYHRIKDPSLRLRMAFELRMSHSKATFRELLLLLEKEEDPFCKSTLLSSLLYLAENGYGEKSSAGKLIKYAASKNTESRKNASLLYFILSTAPDPVKVLTHLKGKNDEYIMQALFPFFVRHIAKIPANFIQQWQKEKDLCRRAWGNAFALLRGGEKFLKEEFQTLATAEKTFLIRRYLAKSAAYKKDLPEGFYTLLFQENKEKGLLLTYLEELKTLSSLSRTQEKTVRQLLSGESLSCKLAAAEALKNAKEKTSAESLVQMLADKDPLLREEVIKSLVQINPDSSIRAKIIAYAASFPPARLDAANFFAKIRDPRFDKDFIRFLGETGQNKDHEIREIRFEEIAISLLGKGKVKESVAILTKKSASKKASVRKCVAESLGMIPSDQCLAPLKKLLMDKDPQVAYSAISSVLHLIKKAENMQRKKFLSTYFGKSLRKIISGRNADFPEVRSAAIYAGYLLSFLPLCEKDLVALASKECIIVPQSPKTFDLDHVRLSALLALYEAGEKGDKKCGKSFDFLLSALIAETNKKDSYASESWKEYLRQLHLMKQKKKIVPSFMERVKPQFTIFAK